MTLGNEPEDPSALEPGRRLEVTVGPVAHGGHFVARHLGRVIFVRHTLPGERVVVEITEESGRFLRADAVKVLRASPHRVAAPCPYARPDGCGGCDFQHVDLAEQRELKAVVVREQLQRLAGLDREVVVEPVPGDQDGLRWRTRMQHVALRDGRRGLRKYRSHDVVPIDDCLIARADARVTSSSRARAPAPTVVEQVVTSMGTRRFQVAADGFWQVHPGAPATLVEAVLEMLSPKPGETVLDLYAGAGLYSAFLAEAVGSAGSVTAVESDRRAAECAAVNLVELPWASVVLSRVDRLVTSWVSAHADLVVLDPPRAGAKRVVTRWVAGLAPRAVAYVACDPATLARDLSYFSDAGYELADLRAFDQFPMTHHVECVALLQRPAA
ncbi:MAG: TRAM domain-containing protein [Actinomycetota bacterium]|nr:TRAM domain-containing protein [Actinomycetota bacterium]